MNIPPSFALAFPRGVDWIWVALLVLVLFGSPLLPRLVRTCTRTLREFKEGKTMPPEKSGDA